MSPRPPVVTILGHVDHGKTSILDFFRKSRITAKEHGGITQRIGGYEIDTGLKGYPVTKITFIDTPGHEAFSQLRSRGAQIADIALLVIDAKDSLMPQTVESIFHIKAAKIPFIVVLNKIDLPEANPNKVLNDLLKHEVLTEEKGGTIPVVKVSAKEGTGMQELLETILLITSDSNLEYDEAHAPVAYVIENKKDKRGIVASIIVKDGKLTVGDTIYADNQKCKIKAFVDEWGKPLREILPSTPCEILGFNDLPQVGTALSTKPPEIITPTAADIQTNGPMDIAAMLREVPIENEKKLYVIVKADTTGSLEAILSSLQKNPTIDITLSGIGNINRSDIFLAKATKAIIIGFETKPTKDAQDLAKQEKIIIKTYNIIYELLDELEEVSQILLEKEQKEKNAKGEAKIVATFQIEGETIFGVKINKGKFNLGDPIEVVREGKPFGKTRLVSLKQRAKKVGEVKKDQEAGMSFAPILDLKVGDVIQSVL